MRQRLILLLVAWLITSSAAPAEEAFRFPPGKHENAELRYVNGVPVLSVSGTPRQMGTAIGTLAVKPGARILTYPRELLKLRRVDLLWNTFVGSGRTMFKQFPAPYQEEVEAIVQSAPCDRELVIAGNT